MMLEITKETFDHFGIDPDDHDKIYKYYKLYACMRVFNSKMAKPIEERKRLKTERYHCDVCDKPVRIAVKYQHEHTKGHLKLLSQNAS